MRKTSTADEPAVADKRDAASHSTCVLERVWLTKLVEAEGKTVNDVDVGEWALSQYDGVSFFSQ
jgi:hypothetical protein